jgi:cobalt/nickel transport system permease protein
VHIPDGFISPKMYVPAYVTAAALWTHGIHRVRANLREETIPLLAVMTAFAFVLMTVALPLPGGTTAHAAGIAILAVRFGVWIGFISITIVLLLQALILGAGGITALPVNAIAMGFFGSAAAVGAYRLLQRRSRRLALFCAGWLSVTVPAALVALALGLQPLIARAADGTPLFFPFGLTVTVPAVMVPHLVVAVGEGVLTVVLYGIVRRRTGEIER